MSDATSSVFLWLDAIRSGDEAAVNQLWVKFSPKMTSLAQRWLARTSERRIFDEEDVVVDAFEAFRRALVEGRYEGLTGTDELWRLLVAAAGSTIAAGYFSSLNTKLSSTVDELTTATTELTTKTNDLTLKTGELTVARNKAETTASENLKLAQAAEVAREKAEDTVYFSRIALADRAWQNNDVQATIELLNKCQPRPGEVDRRGWESRYLDGLCHTEVLTIDSSKVGFHAHIYGVAFSPDGRWLAMGSASATISQTESNFAIWVTRDYSLLMTSNVNVKNARRLRFSSNSRALGLLDESGSLLLAMKFETNSYIPLDQINSDDFAASAPVAAELDTMATGTSPVVLRDKQTGDVVRTLLHPGRHRRNRCEPQWTFGGNSG